MSSTATSNFSLILLLLWIASVLTSSVNNGLKTDGASIPISNASTSVKSLANNTENVLPTGPVVHEISNVTKTTSIPLHGSSFVGEGGPIFVVPTREHFSDNGSHLENDSNALISKENTLPQISNSNAKKSNNTTSKIVPRKGAALDDTMSANKTLPTINNRPVEEVSTPIESKHINQQQTTEATISHGTITIKHLNSTVKATDIGASSNTSISQTNDMGSSTPKTSTTLKMHKPKPTATIAGSDVDRPMPVSSKSSPFGMPRKIDYIVPVIITIVALPLMGAATYIVYRRGRDCWDKRHYRRMDFLIDGMYNYD